MFQSVSSLHVSCVCGQIKMTALSKRRDGRHPICLIDCHLYRFINSQIKSEPELYEHILSEETDTKLTLAQKLLLIFATKTMLTLRTFCFGPFR